MSLLAVHAGSGGVTALVLSTDGTGAEVGGRGHRPVTPRSPAAGAAELPPEEIWQATLGALREALERHEGGDPVAAIGLSTSPDMTLVWDRETLGAPRAAIIGEDRRTTGALGARLAWLAEREPHTWALVESGRYAVGTLDAYLVARMTRGTWEITDVANAAGTELLDRGGGAWSEERCAAFGVPRDALPEIVPSWGPLATSDPRLLAGLELPVTALTSERSAALVGLACLAPGEIACVLGPDGFAVGNAGRQSTAPGWAEGPAWRSPDGGTVAALQRPVRANADEDWFPSAAMPVSEVASGLPAPTRIAVAGPAPPEEASCQALADALGLPVGRSESPDVVPVGTALLAGLGSGVWHTLEELSGLLPAHRQYEPSGR